MRVIVDFLVAYFFKLVINAHEFSNSLVIQITCRTFLRPKLDVESLLKTMPPAYSS